jgi:hypothetical protein
MPKIAEFGKKMQGILGIKINFYNLTPKIAYAFLAKFCSF